MIYQEFVKFEKNSKAKDNRQSIVKRDAVLKTTQDFKSLADQAEIKLIKAKESILKKMEIAKI